MEMKFKRFDEIEKTITVNENQITAKQIFWNLKSN